MANHSERERAFGGLFRRSGGPGEEINTALVNKRRGFNGYFPMPFRSRRGSSWSTRGRSARRATLADHALLQLRHVSPSRAGGEDRGYFHAAWRQEALLLGQRDTGTGGERQGEVHRLECDGALPGRPGYPVDQNEKFFIDGEISPPSSSREWKTPSGLAGGSPNREPVSLDGLLSVFQGGCRVSLLHRDAISFEKSLRLTIGFGEHEDPMFRREFSRRGNTLQFSSTVYWYQKSRHAAHSALPAAGRSNPRTDQPFWPDKELGPANCREGSDQEKRD